MRKPTPFFTALVVPGVWLVRRRWRAVARAYFAAVEVLMRLELRRSGSLED